MNRTRMLGLGLISLGLSAAIALFTYNVLSRRFGSQQGIVQVVVAAQRIPLGARLTEQHVRAVPWPDDIPLEGQIRNVEDAVGRGVLVPMEVNEPVLETKLAPKEGGAGLTSIIPSGLRAVAVKVNEVVGVAGFVLPGTRVDVILTGSPDERNRNDTSKVILENVQVLSAGPYLEQEEADTPRNVTVVTLLVTPEGAQKLALASAGGQIQLALRNPLDLEETNPPAVRRTALYLGESASGSERPVTPRSAPRRTRAPVSPPISHSVELIQGDKRETWNFEGARR